jgi:alkylhydroperoxidase family enzyme
MAWIRTVDPREAQGLLKSIYDAAVRRAGKVFNIVRIQSLGPPVLEASTRLYVRLMHSPQRALTRPQREMIATVVSRVNGCHY